MQSILEMCLTKDQILINEPMKNHTTFKIGGPVDVLVLPGSVDDIKRILQVCQNIDYMVIGNGSNILFTEKGYRGLIIKLCKNFNSLTLSENTIIADSGALLSTIAKYALDYELTGFEFASGIPGTLGGAVFMNAGAYEHEIKNVFFYADVLNKQGEIRRLYNEDMHFGYRQSILQNSSDIVLSTALKLSEGKYEAIKDLMNTLNAKRKEKQPLDLPSAGSAFKRPQGFFAAKLIEDSGLKGFVVGGAQVSDKHSGFIVNKGNATADDVLNLIEHVKSIVKEKFGVCLETEIKIVGER